MEEDFLSRIAADSAIAAAVALNSIAWGDRPQASSLPAITLERIGGGRAQHMGGFQGLQGIQVQADVWSKNRKRARDIKELLIAAVVPPATAGSTRFSRSFVDREQSSFERTDTGVVYRERLDFTVWFAAAA